MDFVLIFRGIPLGGSFDTRAHFVAGDPAANFGATAPLEYMKLLVRSGTRTGGQSSNTFCVSVDTS